MVSSSSLSVGSMFICVELFCRLGLFSLQPSLLSLLLISPLGGCVLLHPRVNLKSLLIVKASYYTQSTDLFKGTLDPGRTLGILLGFVLLGHNILDFTLSLSSLCCLFVKFIDFTGLFSGP